MQLCVAPCSGSMLAGISAHAYPCPKLMHVVWMCLVLDRMSNSSVCRWKTFLLGVLAGVYIAFGGALSYAIGGQVPQVQPLQLQYLRKSPPCIVLYRG